MKTYAFRLKPGEDLKKQLEQIVKCNNIRAGIILTGIGSLIKASIRLAEESISVSYNDKFEIIALSGTLSKNGVHIHISIADSEGKVLGGHLLEGCIIYTTAEIVLGELENMEFFREQDVVTGFKELTIKTL